MRTPGCQAWWPPNFATSQGAADPFRVCCAGFSPYSPVGRGIRIEARTANEAGASYIRPPPGRGEDFPYARGLARAILLVGEGQLHLWPCHYESSACEVPARRGGIGELFRGPRDPRAR